MRRNPYLNRSMIRAVDQFYGRRPELERLMARIGAPTPQSVSVVGQRRVGKSSFLWHLSQEAIYSRYLESPEKYLFLMLDFQGQQHLDLGGFCRVFGQHLQSVASARLAVPELGGLSALEQAVQSLDRVGLRLVCLFDEFEAVTRNLCFSAEFFGFLRFLANTYPVAFARFLEEIAPGAIQALRPPPSTALPRRREESPLDPLPEGSTPFSQIVGQSAAIRRVFAFLHKAIAAQVTVLISGETGTGKERVARAIHQHGQRQGAPFVAVNCGAIPEQY